MRLILDTNILISALITQGTPPDLLYQAWNDGLFELITSNAQIEELARALQYEKLKQYILPFESQRLTRLLHVRAKIIERIPSVNYSPDPADNPIIATAIAGNADYIVSGDKKDLLSLGKVAGIQIINARQALELL